MIVSRQDDNDGALTSWIKREMTELEIVATYNLIFNASLMVEEGLGDTIESDKIINTSGNDNLCFRPLSSKIEDGMSIIWEKYQVFSKTSKKLMEVSKELPTQMIERVG